MLLPFHGHLQLLDLLLVRVRDGLLGGSAAARRPVGASRSSVDSVGQAAAGVLRRQSGLRAVSAGLGALGAGVLATKATAELVGFLDAEDWRELGGLGRLRHLAAANRDGDLLVWVAECRAGEGAWREGDCLAAEHSDLIRLDVVGGLGLHV